MQPKRSWRQRPDPKKGAAAEGPAPALPIAPGHRFGAVILPLSHQRSTGRAAQAQFIPSPGLAASRTGRCCLFQAGRRQLSPQGPADSRAPWQTDLAEALLGEKTIATTRVWPPPLLCLHQAGWAGQSLAPKMLPRGGWQSPTPISVLCPPPPAPKRGGMQLGMAPLATWQLLRRCRESPAAVTGRCGARRSSAPRKQSLPAPLPASSCPDGGAQPSPDPPPGTRRQWLCPFRAEQMRSSKVLQGERFIFTVHHHLGICTERREHKDSRDPPGCCSRRLPRGR